MTRALKIGTSSPIPDRMMIYDDLTILMYSNIIKNNSYPLPSKSVTRAPKIGTSSPIPDRMMIYDDLTILMYTNIIKNYSYLFEFATQLDRNSYALLNPAKTFSMN